MSFKGTSSEQTMQEYVNIVKGILGNSVSKTPQKESSIGSNANNNDSTPLKATTSAAASINAIKKQGLLYKQRDVFKGWRPRHFVLQESLLHYYIDADDPVPRKTLDVSGCSAIAIKSTIVDGVEYFPFVITHPKSPITYNLASVTKTDSDAWLTAILGCNYTGNFVQSYC